MSLQRSPARAQKTAKSGGSTESSAPSAGAFVSRAPLQRTPRFAQAQGKKPAIPLKDGAAQTKVAVGAAGDPFEREADAVSNRVTSGERGQPSSISSVTPGAVSRAGNEQSKKPEGKKPGQQADAKN